MSFDWFCPACKTKNDKLLRRCQNCRCPNKLNGFELDLYKHVVDVFMDNGKVRCPRCEQVKLEPVYSEDYKKYYFDGVKKKSWTFKTLEIHVKCTSCDYKRRKEHEVPTLRRLFRQFFNRDLESDFLRNI